MSRYYNPMGCDGIWRARTDRIMPIAFDDTLSVIQCVNMLKDRLNDACEKIQELEEIVGNCQGSLDSITERVTGLEASLSALRVDVDSINTRVMDLEVRMDSLYNDITEYIDSEIERLSEEIEQWIDKINELFVKYNELATDITRQILKQWEVLEVLEDVLNHKIDTQIASKSGNTIIVRNPTTGEIDTLTNTLDDIMHNYGNVSGISFEQYNSAQISYDEYNSEDITFDNYNRRGSFELLDYIVLSFAYDKLYDIFNEIRSAINMIVEEVKIRDPVRMRDSGNKRMTDMLVNNHYAGWEYDVYNNSNISYNSYNDTEILYDRYESAGMADYISDMTIIQTPNEGDLDYHKRVYGNNNFFTYNILLTGKFMNHVYVTLYIPNGYRVIGVTSNFKDKDNEYIETWLTWDGGENVILKINDVSLYHYYGFLAINAVYAKER